MFVSKDYQLATVSNFGEDVAAWLWALKALLTGQVSGIGTIPDDVQWEVVKTCDSVTVSATDLFGTTFNAAKWVWNTAGNAHSWGVWTNGTKWMRIDCAASAVNSYAQVTITFNNAAFQDDGTTTTAPTILTGDSIIITGLGLATGWAITGTVLAHLMVDNDGEFIAGLTTTYPSPSTFGEYGFIISSNGGGNVFDASLVAPGYTYLQDSGLGTEAVAICNRALMRVGESDVIDALDDETENARLCNAIYALCRDEVLAEADWPFARRRAVLTELEDIEHQAWTYAYALPADLIAARDIWMGARRTDTPVPFAVELRDDGGGPMLLTDQAAISAEAPYLTYTARVESASLFSIPFADALAWRIAMDIALPLSGKPDVQKTCTQMYEVALSKAETSNSETEALDPRPDSLFVTSRS